MADFIMVWLVPFVILCLWRYVRTIVNGISSVWFRNHPRPLPSNPTFTNRDVTVIIPTIGREETTDEVIQLLNSVVRTNPFEILMVTIHRDVEFVCKLVTKIDTSGSDTEIRVLSIARPNKRHQLSYAIPQVRTQIIVHADNDVIWPVELLTYILTPFEDVNTGAVGTLQRVRRNPDLSFINKIWEYLGACYIERRNFEITGTSNIDGGMSCLSGRTGAFRAKIVQDQEFLTGYCNEEWNGRILNPDDDNFVTRWLVNHGWNIIVQVATQAVVETTLECSTNFWSQCMRWARSNWRSNFTSTVVERTVWTQQPWCTYALHLATPLHSVITEPLLFCFLYLATAENTYQKLYLIALAIWVLFAKLAKYTPLWVRRPSDLLYIPVNLIFGYVHGYIKYYTLFTLSQTTWGSLNLNTTESEVPSEGRPIVVREDSANVDEEFVKTE